MTIRTTETEVTKDVLDPAELAEFKKVITVLVEGEPYLFLMTFGWAYVAYYVQHIAPNRILVAHCSHFRDAGCDYGQLVTRGATANCEWRYEGLLAEINTLHVMKITPYPGKVHRVTASTS